MGLVNVIAWSGYRLSASLTSTLRLSYCCRSRVRGKRNIKAPISMARMSRMG